MKFSILLPPVGQKRARSRAFKSGHGPDAKYIATTYKDKGQRQEENKLLTLMYEHKPPMPLQGPLSLHIQAMFPIPKSKPLKWRTGALEGKIKPTTKPDADNLAKHILDVMSGVFFEDDRQIVFLCVQKSYSNLPRWVIELEEF